jgi:CBS domain-containing protein
MVWHLGPVPLPDSKGGGWNGGDGYNLSGPVRFDEAERVRTNDLTRRSTSSTFLGVIEMKVKEIMATDVATVVPSTPLKDVARLFADRRIAGAPVVDECGSVLGVVSERDILEKERDPERPRWHVLRTLVSRRYRRVAAKREARTAGAAMTSPAITISPFASVAEAASSMADCGVDRLVVTEDFWREKNGESLAGIVTRGDLVHAFARSDAELEREIRTLIEYDFRLLPGEVRVGIARGEVTLEGAVDCKGTAEGLEALVRQIPGVLALHSKLTLASSPIDSPTSSAGVAA